MQEKEYVLECECGAKYKFQGNRENLDRFLDSQTWMCELGRHAELGKKGEYLQIIGERDQLIQRTEVERKKESEYTVLGP